MVSLPQGMSASSVVLPGARAAQLECNIYNIFRGRVHRTGMRFVQRRWDHVALISRSRWNRHLADGSARRGFIPLAVSDAPFAPRHFNSGVDGERRSGGAAGFIGRRRDHAARTAHAVEVQVEFFKLLLDNRRLDHDEIAAGAAVTSSRLVFIAESFVEMDATMPNANDALTICRWLCLKRRYSREVLYRPSSVRTAVSITSVR